MNLQSRWPSPASVADRAAAKRVPSALSILFGTIMLLAVLGVLGRPAVFPDTDAYVRYGSGFYHLVAQHLRIEPPPPPPDSPEEAADRRDDLSMDLTVMAARSPWYGAFIWPVQRYGTIWLVAALQSLVGAWLVWLLWRTTAPDAPPWTAYAVQGATALFSTLPFVAGFVMPDVFTAYLILGVTLLLVSWGRLRPAERAGLLLLTFFECRFHGANSALSLVIAVTAGVASLLPKLDRRAARISIIVVLLTLGASVAAGKLVDMAIVAKTGQAPGRPPFLAMRMIADGPGRKYLRRVCAEGATYRLCRYKGLPLDNIEDMIWSTDAKKGIFLKGDTAHRMILEREEKPFVVGVVLSDPVGVVLSSLNNWRKQLGMVAVHDPLIDPELYIAHQPYIDSPLRPMVERIGSCGPDHHGCRTRLTQPVADRLQTVEFILAAAIVAILAARSIPRLARPALPVTPQWLEAAGLATVGLLANALLYGAIAGPFFRYQSSVAWIATTMAAVGLASCWRRQPVKPASASLESVGAVQE